MRRIVVIFLLMWAAYGQSQSVDTLFYSIVSAKQVVGTFKKWPQQSGEASFSYMFNDRGLGTSYSFQLKLNSDGTVAHYQLRGVDYNKNPVSRTYTRFNDSVERRSNGTSSTSAYKGGFEMDFTTPALYEALVKWMVKQPEMKGLFEAGGNPQLLDLGERQLHHAGQQTHVRLYGFSFDPTKYPSFFVWWDVDKNDFFAELRWWQYCVKRGFEALGDTLFQLQEEAYRTFDAEDMGTLSKDMPKSFSLLHANIFQAKTASLRKNMTVEVANGKIRAIYPSGQRKAQGDTLIDVKGKFLMPGLWDTHAHINRQRSLWYLAGGVTHVRDMGNSPIVQYYRTQIRNNDFLGPDVSYLCGLIDKTSPYQVGTGTVVSSLAEAIDAIHQYHRSGYNAIKIYSSIDTSWVRPMCAESKKLGMWVNGHIPMSYTSEKAVKAGYNELTHMLFVMFNFLQGDTMITRGNKSFAFLGEKGGEVDLRSARVQQFIKLLKQNKTVVEPTVGNMSDLYNEVYGDTAAAVRPVMHWISKGQQQNFLRLSPFATNSTIDKYRATYRKMISMVKLLYDNGIPLLAGTDGAEANGLHYELDLFVQSGIPAAQVLKIATYDAAKVCGLQTRYGDVHTGREVDFILIDGNPAKNIQDIRRVEWVMKNGKWYHPAILLKAQGWGYYR